VENLTGLLSSRMGTYWPDADGFLKRRDYATWKAWMKEMLTILTGGQAMPVDLAQVCRDDGALARPIGSPKGLRHFVGSAVDERKHPKQSGPRAPKNVGTGGRAYSTTLDAIEDL
jgi:hypothetical protein